MHTNNISDFSTCQSCLNKTLWKSPPSGLFFFSSREEGKQKTAPHLAYSIIPGLHYP